jgi:GT2 family glycosyltransferase
MSAPTDRLTETRAELRRARFRAAEALDQAHRHSLSQLDGLHALRDAPDRQWLLRQRARLLAPFTAVRHPWRTLRGVGQRVGIALRLHHFGPAAEHVLYRTTPLRGFAPVGQETDQPSVGDAVRWLGRASVHGVARHSLFLHPTSSVTWEVPVPAAANLIVNCALVPEVAHQNPHGVVFTVDVTLPDGTTQTLERHVHPRVRPADTFWRAITIDLPGHATAATTIRVTSRLPDHGSAEYAWALVGEPRVRVRRPLSEMWRLFRAVLSRDGFRGVLRRATEGPIGADLQADYRRWVAAHPLTDDAKAMLHTAVSGLRTPPTFSVITPVYNTDPVLLRACIESVLAQIYPHWELLLVDDASPSAETRSALDAYRARDPRIRIIRLEQNGHISRASNAGLDVATGDYIALLDHDDELTPDALAEMALAIDQDPSLDFLYSDEDKLAEDGTRCDPYFKPDWSPEQFLNFMYTNHLMVLRRSLINEVGRFRVGYEGSQDFDLALRVITRSSRVGHVPKILYHWRKIAESTAADAGAKPWATDAARRALTDHIARTEPTSQVLDGAAPGLFRVKRRIAGQPLVSLVITTDDRSREVQGRVIPLLPHLLRSIVSKTAYANYEIVIADNGRLSDSTRDLLATIPHRRAQYTINGPFNFAHKLNFAARHATGEHLVILNDDIEVVSSEWLTALLEYSQDPAIGAVGAKLLYPDGRLQHIGVVLGVCGVAAHAFHQFPGHHPGYAGSSMGPRNYSAVTGACLMTRRAVFDQLGGFNEGLAIDFNDIDYCLRVRQAGYRIVYTPYAELYHLESGTISDRTWNPAETEYMKATWAGVLARDPYYNQNLTREFPDYRLP